MRRVIVEDSTDGLRLCKIIAKIYSPDGEAISVESFHGMVNLKRKIEELCAELKPTDDAIIVYDGIKENPLVLRHAEEAFGYLEASGKEDRFRMLDTISFELEVLMTDGIEYFADLAEYGKYVSEIRELYKKYNDLSALALYTKGLDIYSGMYDKIRKNMRKKGSYKKMGETEFESCVTIESLSKELLNRIFASAGIDRPMTECWVEPCCVRKRKRCESGAIDTYKIEEMQRKNNDPYVKANMLICNTSYRKLAELLATGREIIEYNIADFRKDELPQEI